MNEALTTALMFPTLPLSVLLAFVVIYWALAATGLLDSHSVDHWIDGDVGDIMHSHGHNHDASSASSSLAAFLSRIGLTGVPFMVSMSILVFFTWCLTYYTHLLFLTNAAPALRIPLGIAALVVCFVASVVVTVVVLKPIRWVLHRIQPVDEDKATVIGKEGVVLSPVVDAEGGRAEFDNGGAGLILQVKSMDASIHQRGARVIIVAHNQKDHVYEVMSKEAFHFQK